MKKLAFALLFLCSFAFSFGQLTAVQKVQTIVQLKAYNGSAAFVFVADSSKLYATCSPCVADEISIFAGYNGKKWKAHVTGSNGNGGGDSLFTSYAQMRAIPTANLKANSIILSSINGTQRQWYYDPADNSSSDDTAMTIVTAGNKRLKAFVDDGWINAKWFGATGDGTTDDYYNLQRGINWTIAHISSYKKFRIPHGIYRITNGLVVLKDANADGTPEFITMEIAGDANSIGFGSTQAATVINATHNDNFALAIQWGKGCRVSNLALKGVNDISAITMNQVYSGDRNNFITGGARSNQYSPLSGIVIDPFHGSTLAGNKYPRMTGYYNNFPTSGTTGSTDIVIDNVYIENFVVGVIFSPNGVSQNAEACVIKNSWIQFCTDAVVNAQSQTRTNQVNNVKVWGGVHTVFNNTTYGQQNGDAPYVTNLNVAGYNYQLLKLTSGWSGANFSNSFFELLYRLGEWGSGTGGLPVSFDNCQFSIPADLYPPSPKFIGNEAVFKGCILRMYNNALGYITSGGNNITVINSQLSGPIIPYRDFTSNVDFQKWMGRVKYINSTTYFNPPASNGLITSELYENSLRSDAYGRAILGVQYAWIKPAIFGNLVNPFTRDPLPLSYEYKLSGEGQMYSGLTASDASRTITFGNNGTASFTSANPDRYMVNDLLAQNGIATTIDGEGGISSTILGVVSSIVGSTINLIEVPAINGGATTKTGVDVLGFWQSEFQEPVVGNITSGSATITNVHFTRRLSQMRIGTPLVHPSFPYYTRVTAINTVARTITVSKNATASETQAELTFTRLSGTGTATQNPGTIDWSAYIGISDTTSGLIIKGSMIYNVGTDTTIQGWLCTRTGFLNTTMPPAFKEQKFTSGTGSSIRHFDITVGDDHTIATIRDSLSPTTKSFAFDADFDTDPNTSTLTLQANTDNSVQTLATQGFNNANFPPFTTFVGIQKANQLTFNGNNTTMGYLVVDSLKFRFNSSINIPIQFYPNNTQVMEVYSDKINFFKDVTIGAHTTPVAPLDARTSSINQVAYFENSKTSGNSYAAILNSLGTSSGTNIGINLSASGGAANRALRIDNPPVGADNYAIYSISPAQSYFVGKIQTDAKFQAINSPASATVADSALSANRSTGDLEMRKLPDFTNATNLTTGTLSDSRLSSNVPLLNAATNTFTGVMNFATGTSFSSYTTQTQANFAVTSNTTSTSTNANTVPTGITTVRFRIRENGGLAQTLTAGESYFSHIIGQPATTTEAATLTHDWVGQVMIKALPMANAAGATNNAATLYIEGPTTGITAAVDNNSLWVGSGNSRFDGQIKAINISGVATVADSAMQVNRTTGLLEMRKITAASVSDATTVGRNLLTLANPSAITFPKYNADNTVTAENAATHRTSIGLGSVENTALSTWAGSANITTLGTVTTGTWTAGKLTPTLTTEQLRTAFDGSNYMTVTTASAGSTTFDLVGTSPTFSFGKAVAVTGNLSSTGNINSVGSLASGSTTTTANFATVAANGVATTSTSTIIFGGASQIKARIWEAGSANGSLATNDSYGGHIIGNHGVTGASAGTHAAGASLAVRGFTFTPNATTPAAMTNAGTIWIDDAPTGATNNYALYIKAGNSWSTGKFTFDNTITPGGTNGAQTINKPTGTVNIAAAGTSVVVTNSLVTANSIVYAVLRTNDANATVIKSVVPAAGSFTINITPAPAGAVSIGFIVFN